jgi:hypothetical protein
MLLDAKVGLKQTTKSIGGSAGSCYQLLNRTGNRFWQEESFDHGMRDAVSFEKIRSYIERNPVSTGLMNSPQDWRWSSAKK